MDTTSNTRGTDTPTAPVQSGLLVRRGGLALVVAVLANSALVLLSNVAGIAPELAHLSFGRVAVFTGIGVIGATALYALLARVVQTPDRTFTLVVVVATALSMFPTAIVIPGEPGATLAGTVMLGVMHLPPAVASVVFLTDRLPRKRSGTR
jgi:hypothetical protein